MLSSVIGLVRSVEKETLEGNGLILKSQMNWCSRGLVLIVLLFLIWRIPIVLRDAGGQDEEWFAIPGWTILQAGVPRVPYAPQRHIDSAFYKADAALFALPPLYYYLSAPLYSILPPTYSTTRLLSVMAGVVSLLFIYMLACRVFKDPLAGLAGAGLFSLSRTFFFPATVSRPDMLCGMWGLLALWLMWRWYDNQKQQRYLVLSGIALGLGMLTHPFALVYCIQIGIWVILVSGTLRERLIRAVVLVGCALALFALWVPLIVAYPEIFRIQFFTNVLDRSGPGLVTRLLFPWPYFSTQFQLLIEHAGQIQVALMLAGLFGGTWMAWRSEDRRTRIFMMLVWSSIYLLIACQGYHPTKGYWCYPGALLFLCIGWGLSELGRRAWERSLVGRMGAVMGSVLIVAAMMPGSGVRTWLAHIDNWSNVNYNAPQFVSQILNDLPAEARYTVDRAYVFDFSSAGRATLLGDLREFSFDARPFPYDYLIVSHDCIDMDIATALNGRLIGTYGDPDDRFSCYVEVYVPQDSPVRELK
ncbi:MAG: glycosyltransferase family 39 protein [Gimesia sp.]